VTHNFGATNQQAKLHARFAAAWLSRAPKLKISFGASDGERSSVLISSSVRAIVNEHLLRRLIQKLGSGRAVVDRVSSHATCCNDSEAGKQGHCNPEDIRHKTYKRAFQATSELLHFLSTGSMDTCSSAA
jgi:hypothetical protein